jgi:hypothetical protein
LDIFYLTGAGAIFPGGKKPGQSRGLARDGLWCGPEAGQAMLLAKVVLGIQLDTDATDRLKRA